MSELKAILMYLEEINLVSATLRIVLATLLGGCIGMDRGRHGRAAGARTHILVSLGACITTLLGFYAMTRFSLTSDPLRMGAQVVSGIGFLGVGTIMIRSHMQVTGLTTAAGMWTTACIGLAIGAGFYWVALIAFLMVMLTFSLLSRLEHKLIGKDNGAYYIEVTDLPTARELYNAMDERMSGIDIVPPKCGIQGNVGIELVVENPKDREAVFAEFQANEKIAIAVHRNP